MENEKGCFSVLISASCFPGDTDRSRTEAQEDGALRCLEAIFLNKNASQIGMHFNEKRELF